MKGKRIRLVHVRVVEYEPKPWHYETDDILEIAKVDLSNMIDDPDLAFDDDSKSETFSALVVDEAGQIVHTLHEHRPKPNLSS